jgi:hypothetical protein
VHSFLYAPNSLKSAMTAQSEALTNTYVVASEGDDPEVLA